MMQFSGLKSSIQDKVSLQRQNKDLHKISIILKDNDEQSVMHLTMCYLLITMIKLVIYFKQIHLRDIFLRDKLSSLTYTIYLHNQCSSWPRALLLFFVLFLSNLMASNFRNMLQGLTCTMSCNSSMYSTNAFLSENRYLS